MTSQQPPPLPPTQPPSLAYYGTSAAEAPMTRPTSVTVIAVIGIVLASLMIVGQQFNLAGMAYRWNTLRSGRVSTEAAIGAAVGLATRNLFTLLMLVGCCGALAMRQVGRRTALVAAYGWVVFGVLELWFLLQNAYLSKALGGGATTYTGILIATAIIVLTEIAYPVAAIIVLRPRRVYELYARQPARRPVMPRLFKPVAIVVIVAGAMWALDGVLTLEQVTVDRPMYRGYVTPRLLQLPGAMSLYEVGDRQNKDFVVLDGVLWTLLSAAWVTGGVLVLNRRREGVWVIIVCCVARLAFAVGMGTGREATLIYSRPGGAGGTFSLWPEISLYVRLMASRLQPMLVPALLLVVFTHRAGELASAPQGSGVASPSASPKGR